MNIANVRSLELKAQEMGQEVVVAGRVRLSRSFGKLSFLTINDHEASIQIGLKGKMKLPQQWDIIKVKGTTGFTKTNELTIWAEGFETVAVCEGNVASKYDGIEDRGILYNNRHLGLLANPEDLEILVKRSQMVFNIRKFLNDKRFIEIETPVLARNPSGATAKPFETHHFATGENRYLRIATELNLKKALICGLERVYEIGKIFRNEGEDWKHNPEFTSIELYQAYAGLPEMKALFLDLLQELTGLRYDAPTFEYDELVAKYGEDFDEHLKDLCFVVGQPIEQTPLCKARPDGKAERFEVYANGYEIANAYNEINTFVEQSARMEENDDFLNAMKYGMPPTGGIGIGIDRLAMYLLRSDNIKNVIFFPKF